MEAELELVTSATPGIAIGGVCEGLSAAPRIEPDDPGRRARVGDEKEIDVHHITFFVYSAGPRRVHPGRDSLRMTMTVLSPPRLIRHSSCLFGARKAPARRGDERRSNEREGHGAGNEGGITSPREGWNELL
jgi:hypothetical protein